MYVVMDDRIFGSHGMRPHPSVYMNWFQELHDPGFPIESQWFVKINSVIRSSDQESGATMAMANYMMPIEEGEEFLDQIGQQECFGCIYKITRKLVITITERKRTP